MLYILTSFWVLLVLSYAKNICIRRAISSGNLEELDIIWQPQIKDNVKASSHVGLVGRVSASFIMFSIIYFDKQSNLNLCLFAKAPWSWG